MGESVAQKVGVYLSRRLRWTAPLADGAALCGLYRNFSTRTYA